MSNPTGEHDHVPWSGSIPIAAGQASVVRIPIPGEHGLAVELRPRDAHFVGNTSSTLFIQDVTGKKRILRLDYGKNPNTNNTVNYHWNQKSVYARFGIADHTVVGPAGRIAYHAARGYRYLGRVLLVVGVAVDVASIVQADQPLRRATQVAAAWALAWAGCKAGGYVGAGIGTAVEPGLGTAGGGFAGCIIGGYGGYRAGEAIGDVVYQWAENTHFMPLPDAPVR